MADKDQKPGIIQIFTGGGSSAIWWLLGLGALGIGGLLLWRKLHPQARWEPVLSSIVDSPTLAAGAISAGWIPVLSVLVDSPTLAAGVISAGWTPVLAALVNSPILRRAAIVGGLAGYVRDARTGLPIEGIHVKIEGLNYEDHTDASGLYVIQDVPVGSYIVWADDNEHSPIRYAQQNKTVTVQEGFTTFLDFDLAPVGTALGFRMQIDFDPSSWPTAKYWYADVSELVYNWFLEIQLNLDALWNVEGIDMSGSDFASQTLTSELYDANYNLLVRRIVPLGGAAGPKIVNGHTYSFNQNQAHLYDMGPY